MNREEVIRMARYAHRDLVTLDYPGHAGQLDPWTITLLERFAALVAAAERGACCNIVYGLCESDNVAQRTVNAIRARGQENKS